jgi:SNF2 family DNA or RNA helicase
MNVATTQPFALVYSIFQHEYLGYLLESFVVQLNAKGQLTLQYQNISSKNAQEFSARLDDTDFELIKEIDSIQPEAIVKKFYNKKIHVSDFFLKIYDAQKGDKVLQESIELYLEHKKALILERICQAQKALFVMGTDGNPTWKALEIATEPATVLFHFRRNEEDTHYFPTIKYQGQKLDFQYQNAFLIAQQPAWLVLHERLYHFSKKVDGHKLKPFLNKKFILIPRNIEDTYYRKFVAPLIASFDVYAKGFDIVTEKHQAEAVLHFSALATEPVKQLFAEEAITQVVEEPQILFELQFRYGTQLFRANNQREVNISVEKEEDHYTFRRLVRDLPLEQAALQLLKKLGLPLRQAKVILPKKEALQWIERNHESLQDAQILLQQDQPGSRRYFLGKPTISVHITENKDWFDVHTLILFGEYQIPFLELRKYILQRQTEFTLPNGEIALIPESWLEQYAELFHFVEPEAELLRLHKQHFFLLETLKENEAVKIDISRKLEKLRNFEEIQDYDTPQGLCGQLRPYQKAGYNWLRFLNEYKLGGCLADHMGLGKTIQTLALLQSEKERGAHLPSLVVVPTSLIYNWELEARKFTPQLRVFTYIGSQREKDFSRLHEYDIVLTSYGILRIDIDLFKSILFNYVILDESQTIKNPSSNIAKAVRELRACHRLLLTGTPLENSTLDLWSQMTFVNPGLLGTQSFFRKEFLTPIEKNNDARKTEKLFAMIKPFILRRNKTQVAKDLPAKIENVQYCEMTEQQAEYYEKVKSYYRNQILEQIETQGIAKSQFMLLRGLTQLRQIANHPFMIDPAYDGSAGKLEEVLDKIAQLLKEKVKILVFSQFVKHLDIVREYLDYQEIPYAYLDGSTKNRQAEVEKFQERDDVFLFLISLKAGGLGLNLTAAEYVFLLDPWWNPAIEAQAIDRAHRIGQQNTVMTYRFIARNTVEEKILSLQQAKQKLANELIAMEEGFVKSLSKEDVLLLLE